MKGELRENIQKVIHDIKEEIEILKQKRESIKSILPDAEITNEQLREYVDAGQKIEKLKNILEPFKEVDSLEDLRKELPNLGKSKTTKTKKKAIIIAGNLKVDEFNHAILKDASLDLGKSITEIKDLEESINEFNEEINRFESRQKVLERYGSIQNIEKLISEKEHDLEVLKKYKRGTKTITDQINELNDALETIKLASLEKEVNNYERNKANLQKAKYYYEMLVDAERFNTFLTGLASSETSKEEKKYILEKLNEELNKMEDYHINLLKDIDMESLGIKPITLEESEKEEEKEIEFIEEESYDTTRSDEISNKGGNENMENDGRFNFNEDGSYNIGRGQIDLYRQIDAIKEDDYIPVEDTTPVKGTKNEYVARAIAWALTGAIAATTVIGAYLVGLNSSKKANNGNVSGGYSDTNLENTPEPVPTEVPEVLIALQNSDPEIVRALEEKGYSEAFAPFMALNFSADQIDLLKQIPYDARVESYARAQEFNYNYIEDYENARATQNLTTDEAVSFVNNAHKLQDYNLFEGANINDYTRFVAGIANKDIMTHENDEMSIALNKTMNDIAAHVIDTKLTGINAITNEDFNRIEALKYIAPAGSDLAEFLQGFVEIVEACLAEPNNIDLSNRAYMYLEIFVKSLNSFDNPLNHLEAIPDSLEENVLTVDEQFNNRAKVEDATDAVIAWDDVVGPLWFTFCQLGDGDDPEYQRWDELFQTATSMRNIVYGEVCNENLEEETTLSLTKGGE